MEGPKLVRTARRLRGVFDPEKLPDSSPVCLLYRQVRNFYLYLNRPDEFFAIMGAVAANMIGGDPFWLLFIAPPSSGKTELIMSVTGIPQIFAKGSISGESAFLSGTSKRERAKDATGGILRQVGNHGLLVQDDITGRLHGSKNSKDGDVMDAERRIFSGFYTRSLGVDGGGDLTWEGRLGQIAGVTPAIDQHQAVAASLGERWINYRWPEERRPEMAIFRLETSNELKSRTGETRRTKLLKAVSTFFDLQDLEFGLDIPRQRETTVYERSRISSMAMLGSRCRSAVARDTYSKEITAWAEGEVEGPTRMAVALEQFYMGMDRIGVPENYCWKIVEKCALDSMSKMRLGVIKAAYSSPDGVYYKDLLKLGKSSQTVIQRVVEDLEFHSIVSRQAGRGAATRIVLDAEIRNELRLWFGENFK